MDRYAFLLLEKITNRPRESSENRREDSPLIWIKVVHEPCMYRKVVSTLFVRILLALVDLSQV